MNVIFPPARSYRILVVADIDLDGVNKIADNFVPHDPSMDMVLACGPFTHIGCETSEDSAVIKANMAAILAQLECIVCRVAYLASDNDPTVVLTEELHLTPNSVNIHARLLSLVKGLFLTGFAETRGNLQTSGIIEDNEEEEVEGVTLDKASSVELISELLEEVKKGHEQDEDELKNADSARETSDKNRVDDGGLGIFALNYKYSHTLNHFLFHIPEELHQANVSVAVIPPPCSSINAEDGTSFEAPKLPSSFGNLHIISPGSLRRGQYAIMDVILDDDNRWSVTNIENCTL